MIRQNIITVLEDNPQFKDFIRNTEDFELMIKKLNQDEIKRLTTEYPELLKTQTAKKGTKEQAVSNSILCLTFVKNNLEATNYNKLKKFKVYIDNSKENIINILRN